VVILQRAAEQMIRSNSSNVLIVKSEIMALSILTCSRLSQTEIAPTFRALSTSFSSASPTCSSSSGVQPAWRQAA